MTIKDTLIKKLEEKTARVAILGMGYVGLPLAVVFAEAGFNVIGIDPDKRKTDSLVKGISYIPDIPTKRLAPLVKSGHLKATTDFSVAERYGRRQHLRADPAAPDRRPGHVLHPVGHRGTGEIHAQGHGGRAGIDHLSGHHPRAACCRCWR